MSRSETIPQPIPPKFEKLIQVRRGNHTSHLPRKFAEVNAALLRSRSIERQGK